jgi:hypothetical protein
VASGLCQLTGRQLVPWWGPGNDNTGNRRETPIKERFMKGHDRSARKLISPNTVGNRKGNQLGNWSEHDEIDERVDWKRQVIEKK